MTRDKTGGPREIDGDALDHAVGGSAKVERETGGKDSSATIAKEAGQKKDLAKSSGKKSPGGTDVKPI